MYSLSLTPENCYQFTAQLPAPTQTIIFERIEFHHLHALKNSLTTFLEENPATALSLNNFSCFSYHEFWQLLPISYYGSIHVTISIKTDIVLLMSNTLERMRKQVKERYENIIKIELSGILDFNQASMFRTRTESNKRTNSN